MRTCNLWLSPTIRGRWLTPKKNTHSRQLEMQIRFAAAMIWTRSQCSTLTAYKIQLKENKKSNKIFIFQDNKKSLQMYFFICIAKGISVEKLIKQTCVDNNNNNNTKVI